MAEPANVMIAKQVDGHEGVVIKDEDGNQLMVVPNGESLTTLEENGDRTKVVCNRIGYAKTSNLVAEDTTFVMGVRDTWTVDDVDEQVRSTQIQETVVAKQASGHDEVVLKDEAGNVVSKVPNGERLTVIGQDTAKVSWKIEGWVKTANLIPSPKRSELEDADEACTVPERLRQAAFAMQADGHPEVVLKDESGSEVARVPNGQKLIVFLQERAVNVRWKTSEGETIKGWAKVINVETSYRWCTSAIELWNKNCTNALSLKIDPKVGDPLSLATVCWLKMARVWDTMLERHLVCRQEELGAYMVDLDRLPVNRTKDATGSCDLSLNIGTEVNVLDFAIVSSDSRQEVFAKIESGWIRKAHIFKVTSPRPAMCSQEVGQAIAQSLRATLPTDPKNWKLEHRTLIIEAFGRLMPRKEGKVEAVNDLLPYVLASACEKLGLPLFVHEKLSRLAVASTFVMAELSRRQICKVEQAVDVDIRIAQQILESTLSYAMALLGGAASDDQRAEKAKAILATPVDASALVAYSNGGYQTLRKRANISEFDHDSFCLVM